MCCLRFGTVSIYSVLWNYLTLNVPHAGLRQQKLNVNMAGQAPACEFLLVLGTVTDRRKSAFHVNLRHSNKKTIRFFLFIRTAGAFFQIRNFLTLQINQNIQ
jgi:hypothetical protein